MSAIDNIFLNREIRNRWGLLDRRAMRRKAEAIFKRLTVAIDLDCPVEQLSVAQQQFVEIAKRCRWRRGCWCWTNRPPR